MYILDTYLDVTSMYKKEYALLDHYATALFVLFVTLSASSLQAPFYLSFAFRCFYRVFK